MKKAKKILGLLLAMVLATAMTMTAFAANITISGGESGSEYAAWKLLNATDGGEGKFAYTVNDKYKSVLQEVTGKTTDADIVAYIEALDTDGIRAFADEVYAKVKNLDPEKTTNTNTFESVDQGYYLIAETKVGSSQDSYSLVMLDTAGKENIEVETKEDVPTVEKKVKEVNDSTGETSGWQDAADYDIGDEVSFQLTGTVSEKIGNYEKYYYEFHDTLSAGLAYVENSLSVLINGKDVTESFNISVTVNDDSTTSLNIKCDDIKAISGVTLDANSKIVVEYKATLNENAVIGSAGNPNTVKLEYSNNPYDKGEGKPSTGTTPEDKVIVFTYKLIVNKKDGKTGEKLEGAGFTLYKYSETEKDYVAVGNEITGVTTFDFQRLDAGKYKLVETTVPNGYNKAEDVIFIVEATYDTESNDPQLNTLVVKDANGDNISEGQEAVFNIDVNGGSVSTDVENFSGSELPSTGGMGTTIFYVLGAILVLGAAIMLIAKKRMSSEK